MRQFWSRLPYASAVVIIDKLFYNLDFNTDSFEIYVKDDYAYTKNAYIQMQR